MNTNLQQPLPAILQPTELHDFGELFAGKHASAEGRVAAVLAIVTVLVIIHHALTAVGHAATAVAMALTTAGG